MYTGDIINSLHWSVSSCAVGVLFEWVLYRTVLCLLVASYLKIKLKKGQVASSECVYRGNMPLGSYPPILVINKSIFTPAYQTFLFVPNSIKLGKACSSNVYSVLRTKAEISFMMIFVVHVNHWSSYYYTPLILPRGLCYTYTHAQTVSGALLSPSSTTWCSVWRDGLLQSCYTIKWKIVCVVRVCSLVPDLRSVDLDSLSLGFR